MSLTRFKKVLGTVALVLVMAGCQYPVVTYDSSDPSPGNTTILARDGNDGYDVTLSSGQMRGSALSGNTGGNLRAVFWPADGPSVQDSQTCATWNSATLGTQQGVALRITNSGGLTQAVTVTKNVYYGAQWIFNFHTWDGANGTQFGTVNLASELNPSGNLAPYPWHVCGRVLGDQISFKVWRNGEPEPDYGNSTHAGSATVPAAYVHPGFAGWYVGHIPPNGSAEYLDLTAYKYVTSNGSAVRGAAATDGSGGSAAGDRQRFSARSRGTAIDRHCPLTE